MANYKNAQKKAASASDVWDKVFAEVSPEVLLGGLLGATAAYGGMTPPFTKMLIAISGGEGSDKINELVLDYKTLLVAGTGAGIGGALFYNMFKRVWERAEDAKDPTEQQKKEIAMTAIAASGFFEGMLMMSFAKNPDVQKAVIEKMTGAGAGLAALAAKL